MARPKRHINGKQITLRLSGAVLDELDAKAHALGVDRSQLINQLIKNNMDQNPYAASEPAQKNAAPALYPAKPRHDTRTPTAHDSIPNTNGNATG